MWQASLWIEADFVVEVQEGVLLSEPYWCIVELAVSLAMWLRVATERGPDFNYTSMDDGQEGLLWFRRKTGGQWYVGSAWQKFEATTPSSFSAIQHAARAYIENVLDKSQVHVSGRLAADLINACTS